MLVKEVTEITLAAARAIVRKYSPALIADEYTYGQGRPYMNNIRLGKVVIVSLEICKKKG